MHLFPGCTIMKTEPTAVTNATYIPKYADTGRQMSTK
jgi:hypothetical protein